MAAGNFESGGLHLHQGGTDLDTWLPITFFPGIIPVAGYDISGKGNERTLNLDHQRIICAMSFHEISMSLKVMVVILIGCCLVSAVSALSGGCGYSNPPAGGWGAASTDKYWGMSAEEIKSYFASHQDGSTSTSSGWVIPAVILPTPQADKFASLSGSKGTIGDAPTLPHTYSGALVPEKITKPGFGVSTKPDISLKPDISSKNSLFM
jgi:hypothetical protein